MNWSENIREILPLYFANILRPPNSSIKKNENISMQKKLMRKNIRIAAKFYFDKLYKKKIGTLKEERKKLINV